MSWGREFLGHLINDIDWCKREEIMSVELLYKAAYLIPEDRSYSTWRYDSVGITRLVKDLGMVTLLHKEDKYDDWDESNTITLVFEVETPDGERALFKKTGYINSYGNETWDGRLLQVQETNKTVTTYTEV